MAFNLIETTLSKKKKNDWNYSSVTKHQNM